MDPSREVTDDLLLGEIASKIIRGAAKGNIIELLEKLDKNSTKLEEFKFKKIGQVESSENMLHLVMSFGADYDVIECIMKLCPQLISRPRTDKLYKGQTPFHIIISKGQQSSSLDIAKMILDTVDHEAERNTEQLQMKQNLLTTRANGSSFQGTVMMGELPLSIAALKFNFNMMKLLIGHGAPVLAQNSHGDTVLHSLVKYAYYYPDKEKNVIDTIQKLIDHITFDEDLKKFNSNISGEDLLKYLFFRENKKQYTPLRLAAKLGQKEIFECILNTEHAYRSLDHHDGVFDIHRYDITEIDKIAMQRWLSTRRAFDDPPHHEPVNAGGSSTQEGLKGDWKLKSWWKDVSQNKHQSVLEMICLQRSDVALEFIKIHAINEQILSKWKRYRAIYISLGIFHFLFMSLLMWQAVSKTDALKKGDPGNKSRVTGINAIAFVICAIYLVQEIYRFLISKQPLQFCKFQHNGIYRVLIVLFATCFFIDFIWFYAKPENSIFLSFALLFGFWLLIFFLRGWKTFSFFTVMIHKVLFGDMLRFLLIICLQLLAFTMAMHITFLQPGSDKEGFFNFGMSLLTMFRLMLGLDEFKALTEGKEEWLPITLFVLFALICYVMLMNALIAMISYTCEQLSKDRIGQWKLQILSIIIFIEGTVPNISCFKELCSCGQKEDVPRYDLELHISDDMVPRYFMKSCTMRKDIEAILDEEESFSYLNTIFKGKKKKHCKRNKVNKSLDQVHTHSSESADKKVQLEIHHFNHEM